MRLFYLILIAFTLLVSCAKDTDGDAVIDKEDKCPVTFGLVEFNGCPDSDDDGIPDSEDDCPVEAGLEEFNGCPDSDEDGIPDNLDDCPDEYGYKIYNGCPNYDHVELRVSECLKSYSITNDEIKNIVVKNNLTLNSTINVGMCNLLVEMLLDRREFEQKTRGYYKDKKTDPYEPNAYSKEKEFNDGYIQAVYNDGNSAQYVVILKDGLTNPTFYLMQVLHGGKCNTGGTTKFDETTYDVQQIWVRHEAYKVPATLFTMRLLDSSKRPFDFDKYFK